MGLREIKAALRLLEREGGEKATKALILAVPYKRGQAPERAEIIGYIAKNRGESISEVKKMLAGWVPGVLIHAQAHDWHPAEGDLVMLQQYSNDYEHTGEIVYPRPDDLRWGEAKIVDDNGELHPLFRWREAVSGILYGTRGSPVYFETEQSRNRNR